MNLNILKIRKRADLVLWLGIFKKIVSVLVFLWTIQYGVAWVVGGQVVASIVTYVPCAVVAARVTSYSVWQQFADFTPSLLLSLALGGVMALIVDLWTFSSLLAYGLSSLGFVVLYLAVAHYLRLQGLMSIKRFVTKALTA